MPYKEKEISKVYWTPSEISRFLRAPKSDIYFTEAELKIKIEHKPISNGLTKRKYTEADRDLLQLVFNAKKLGIPLSTIKMYGLDRLPEIVEFFTKLSQSK